MLMNIHSIMNQRTGGEICIHNIRSVMVTGKPDISHIVNQTGGAVKASNAGEIITEYPVPQLTKKHRQKTA